MLGKDFHRFDIIRLRNVWFILSALIILTGITSLIVKGLNLGIDFTGGRLIYYKMDRTAKSGEIEKIIPKSIKHNPVQLLAGNKSFILRTIDITDVESTEKIDEAKEFDEKIRDLKIAFFLKFTDVDPKNFVVKENVDRKKLDKLLVDNKFAQDAVKISSRKILSISDNIKDEKSVQKLETILLKEFGGYREFEQEDKVDPVFSSEILKDASLALIIAVIGILIYVMFRFEFWFAIAAIIALFHDCTITVGLYSLLGLEVNSAFVAIILTVFGYSINDTIIIFDRIRENKKKDKKSNFIDLVNTSLWETMPRSINTILTTEFSILALLLFGGSGIHDFSLGMFIGITFGCYSSIFIAAPLAYIFKSSESVKRLPLISSAPKVTPYSKQPEKTKLGAAAATYAVKSSAKKDQYTTSDSRKTAKDKSKRGTFNTSLQQTESETEAADSVIELADVKSKDKIGQKKKTKKGRRR